MTTLTPDAPPAGPRPPTATPFERVRRARVLLATVLVLSTVFWALTAGLAMLVLLALLAFGATSGVPALIPVAATLGAFVWPLAAGAAFATVAVGLWRGRAVWSLERVALWLEEGAPELRYALVTAVDPRFAPPAALRVDYRIARSAPVADPALGAGLAALLAAAGRADLEVLVRRAAGRTLASALAAAVFTAAAARLLHVPERLRALGPLAHLVRPGRGSVPLGNRLATMRAEVVPPAYSGLPRRTVADPTSVAGLIGSTLRFVGDGAADGITAVADRDTLHQDTLQAQSARKRDGWAVPLVMPQLPGVIRFQDRQYHRSVVLEPLTDSVPRVLLRAPAKDTTWRWNQPPTGDLVLEADLADDYGLTSAYFEILASTGGAETFETTDKSTPRVRFDGQTHATLRARVRFAALGMAEGTVLHIRAVAYDNNTVADSLGKGVSETRTLRVATKQESDTVSVAAAPPLPIDSTWIGQRVLNALTDTLIRLKQRTLTPQAYTDTASAYADKQELIRQKVEVVIVLLEEDGVGGRQETESSRLLRQASDQMWQARQDLALGQPDSAYVPAKSPMKEALRLLELARKAQKYYLRGRLQARPVDLDAVRLKDTTKAAQAAERSGRAIPEDVRRALRARLAAVLPLVLAAPERGLDSLMLVRAAALRGAPAVAAALQAAIDAAHHGQPVTAPLTRAQRLLDPPTRIVTGPSDWAGSLP